MRTSLIRGLLVVGCVAMLGSGCSTLHRWWYGPDKKPVAMNTGLNQEGSSLDLTNGTSVLDPSEVSKAQTGASFADTKTLDAAAIFAPVHFAYDSFVVPPTETSKIEQVGQFLLENSDRVVIVDGHCDERGSNEYNLSLGEQRAQAVRTYIINLGIDAGRVQTRSFGKEKPLDPGHSESAWAKNRRGEFAIYK